MVCQCQVSPKERKEDKMQFLTSHTSLVGDCCFIALLLHLLDRKSPVDNDGSVFMY